MRIKNLLGKLLIVVSLATFALFFIAGFSLKKLYEQDPQILSRLHTIDLGDENWLGWMQNSTVSLNSQDQSQNNWTIGAAKKRITIKTYNGSFEIKESANSDIHISATGKLDKSISQRLLDIEDSEGELLVQQPKDNAVADLNFVIQIPNDQIEILDVFAASSDILVSGIKVKSMNFKSVSGALRFEDLDAKNLVVKSVSGDIDFRSKKASNLAVDSISGDIRLDLAEQVNYVFKLNSISGNIENLYKVASGDEFKIQVSTASGNVRIE